MLELPEAQTIARQLGETVLGREIISVAAGASPHRFAFFTGDSADYPLLLTGRTIDAAYPLARLVELALGDYRLTLGDGANLRYLAPGAAVPKKHQLLLGLDDGSHLVCTVQMYGSLECFRDGENDNFYYLVTREKPTPLSEGFDADYWSSLLSSAGPSLTAKAFLATEQRIPGLGNGVLQDILFTARIHPKTKLSALTDGELDALFHRVKSVIADMAAKGGRDTEKDLFGNPGGYRTLLSAKTVKHPCPYCLGAIQRQAYLGGNIYFCPHCQPLKL